MSEDPIVNVFAKITAPAHVRLTILAAQLGISRSECYRQALTSASNSAEFKRAMKKLYSSSKKPKR